MMKNLPETIIYFEFTDFGLRTNQLETPQINQILRNQEIVQKLVTLVNKKREIIHNLEHEIKEERERWSHDLYENNENPNKAYEEDNYLIEDKKKEIQHNENILTDLQFLITDVSRK